MLLNSVVILVREVLEAALLLSILMSLTINTGLRRDWWLWAVPLGLLGAILYAAQLGRMAELFDGVGQEIFNALSQILICLLLPAAMVGFIHRHFVGATKGKPLYLLAIGITVLAMLREGAEIYLYLSAFLGVPEWRSSLYAGSAIGFGLGFSVGALFYYWLRSFSKERALLVMSALSAMVAAGMSLQACKMLIQADWLPDGEAWDTSQFLAEDGVAGQLLYALAGYEATPAPVQVWSYAAVFFGSLLIQYGYFYRMKKRSVAGV
jgi:high-affinity iron transporter